MKITIEAGSHPVQSNKDHFILAHGGAGPADPQSERAQSAKTAIDEILQGLCTEAEQSLTSNTPTALIPAKTHTCEKRALWVIKKLERHPLFNAGYGSALQEDGRARVSASMMESSRQRFSAVINVCDLLHPSELAYYLQSQRHSILDQSGATNLTRQFGISIEELITPERFEKWAERKREFLKGHILSPGTGTVGCVSFCGEGQLTAMTSTGGVGNEPVGRVGDTPTIAGNYCDQTTAISCTGFGEEIIDIALAPKIATRVKDGASLKEAMEKTMLEGKERGFQFAAIALSYNKKAQEISWASATTTSYFIWGATSSLQGDRGKF